jgi:NADPH-dependent 2,4-dienoyl-CoA reductase/sulfur reductase-like enzyme/rhodanese-related sulfurtransferase
MENNFMNNPLRVLIVGGVACGPKTACRLKRLLPDCEITMIDHGDLISYGACGLPYYVEGEFPDVAMLSETPVGVARTPIFFEKVKGFKTFTKTKALQIDRKEKRVLVKNLNTGAEEYLPYDKLVIATGSRPVRPPIPGLELKNVWTVRHPDDAESMVESIEAGGLKEAVLVGAGYIGVEVAEALVKRGLKVTMVEIFDQIMPQFLDREMALLAAKHLKNKGVNLVLGEKVLALEGNGAVAAVRTEKREIPAQLVIIGVGVRPNDELARESGLECAPKGGIVIDPNGRTNDPDIYAGGDCVVNRYIDPTYTTPLFVPLGSTANKHGRAIANDIAGVPTPFAGIGSTGICRAFNYTLGRTGFTERQARELYGDDVVSIVWSGPDMPHYMPASKPLIIKMIASRKSRKILGVQAVGMGDVSKRLDVAASAIYFGGTVDDIGNIDLGYAPPYSPPIDPITTTAHILANKLDGLANALSILESKARIDRGDDIVLLDVRTPMEFKMLRLPNEKVVHIPLGALREKLAELPRDKDILAFCKVSMRGYEAQRILNAAGFDRVWFIEGGLVGWPFELEETG